MPVERGRLDRPPAGVGVAAEGRAVGLEGAPVAQARRLGAEVVALAGPLDRGQMALHLALEPRIDCSVGVAMMATGSAEVEQLDPAGPRPKQPLAQEGVEVDAAEPALLVVARAGPCRSCSR